MNMNKEIRYTGLMSDSSSYDCNDGQSQIPFNLIHENNSMRPIAPPVDFQLSVPDEYRLVFIHSSSDNTPDRYILQNKNKCSIAYTTKEVPENIILIYGFPIDYKIYGFNAIGNTLLILTSYGIYYAFFKDGEYVSLGDHFPECHLSFGLQGEMEISEKLYADIPNDYSCRIRDEGDEEIPLITEDMDDDDNISALTNTVLSQVNKFINEQSVKKGRFIFPFLIRYAYRLYDGTLTMHSAPILMLSTNGTMPICFAAPNGKDISILENNEAIPNFIDVDFFDYQIAALCHSIDYSVVNSGILDTLNSWKDIVKSIDVFISKPIYTYDQNGLCKGIAKSDTDLQDVYSICQLSNRKDSSYEFPLRYQSLGFLDALGQTKDVEIINELKTCHIKLPSIDPAKVKSDISDTSNFYFLHSISIESLSKIRKKIEVPEDYLQSLLNREVMTDDYRSHDKLIPRRSFVYNSRLNLADIKASLFAGFNPCAIMPYSDGYISWVTNPDGASEDKTYDIEIYYHIRQNGHEITVRSDSTKIAAKCPVLWIFYPNNNAFKATLVVTLEDNSRSISSIDLTPHPTLEGAYWIGRLEKGYKNLNLWAGKDKTPVESTSRLVSLDSKIYTSEVNNPFLFPIANINTVGSGHVFSICSAARPLSQGQFGQFPLYAFTDQGVWALEVSSTGSYSARQPITRDVCINPEAITQIDSAVLFPTDRGLMIISGSQTQCLTDIINDNYPMSPSDLPYFTEILESEDRNNIFPNKIIPFPEFLKDCGIIYSYVRQHIILFNASQKYAYVFSLKSREWGICSSNIAYAVNNYPNALAVLDNNSVVNYSSLSNQLMESSVPCFLITRPVKLDAPDVLKTLRTVIQRGNFTKGHIKSIIYASRDLVNWHPLYSSDSHIVRGFSGTPYKYFRIAIICSLTADESISGASIEFIPRFNNKIR